MSKNIDFLAARNSLFGQYRIIAADSSYLAAELHKKNTNTKKLVHLEINDITKDLKIDQVVYLQTEAALTEESVTAVKIVETPEDIAAFELKEELRLENLNLNFVLEILNTGSIADIRNFCGLIKGMQRPEHKEICIKIREKSLSNLNDALCGVRDDGTHHQIPEPNESSPNFKEKCTAYLNALRYESEQKDFNVAPYMAAKSYAEALDANQPSYIR